MTLQTLNNASWRLEKQQNGDESCYGNFKVQVKSKKSLRNTHLPAKDSLSLSGAWRENPTCITGHWTLDIKGVESC